MSAKVKKTDITLVYEVDFLLNAYSDRKSQNRVRALSVALWNFFCRNDLFVPPRPEVTLKTLTGKEEILYSDLNERGQAFVVKGGVTKWLRSLDRNIDKNPEDVSILEKVLRGVDSEIGAGGGGSGASKKLEKPKSKKSG